MLFVQTDAGMDRLRIWVTIDTAHWKSSASDARKPNEKPKKKKKKKKSNKELKEAKATQIKSDHAYDSMPQWEQQRN